MSTAQAVSTEAELLARELFTLLEAIDPSRWRDELEPSLRARTDALATRLKALLDSEALSEEPRYLPLRKPLTSLDTLIGDVLPIPGDRPTRARSEWDAFRQKLQPAYEELAAALRGLNESLSAAQLPSLRPTNYARNLLHMASGLGLSLIHI